MFHLGYLISLTHLCFIASLSLIDVLIYSAARLQECLINSRPSFLTYLHNNRQLVPNWLFLCLSVFFYFVFANCRAVDKMSPTKCQPESYTDSEAVKRAHRLSDEYLANEYYVCLCKYGNMVFSECSRSLYAIVGPSVVCDVRAPYSGDWNFRQYFYAIWYHSHPLKSR